MQQFWYKLRKVIPETILFIIVLIVGSIYIFYTYNRIETRNKETVLRIAATTETLIPHSLLDSLSAIPSDTLKDEYKLLKKSLSDVIKINSNARFCYYYTVKANKIFFLADSEPSSSEDFSPPGQEYTEADTTCFISFTSDSIIITDPIVDRWGTWISVFIPVHHPQTGKVIAVFGMDFDASEWRANMFYEIFRSSVVVLLVIILFFFILIIRSKNKSLSNELQHRKNTEFALRESETKYRRISDKMTDVVWLMDFKGKSLFVSPSIEGFTGHTVEEYLNQTVPERFTPESAVYGLQIFNSEIQKYIASPSPDKNHTHTLEMEYICKDGSTKWGELIVTPYLDAAETLIGIHGVTRDITARKKAELELIKAKEKAEESDRLKSAFLSNMSHEIRTPMNGILGFASLLKRPNLSGEKQKTYIELIEKSGERMLNIINDIIDISKIESGQMTVFYSETNISSILETLYNFFLPETTQKNIKLICNNEINSEDNIISTDNDKLYAILTNLIKNAVKFTKAGEIEFGCRKKGKLLEFYVRDTGKGIPPEQQQMVFERFRQGSEAHNREYEGSGLGLAISKAYVQMLGGEITLESNEGVGSKFTFTIMPHKLKSTASETIETTTKDEYPKELSILIAEDNEVTLTLLKTFLENHCKKLLIAKNGEVAVSLAKENPDLDIVFMDMKMPILSGFDATKQIREFNKDLIIIAQTAFAINNEKNQVFDAGCNDYIAKPYTEEDILNLLKKWISKV
jgi:PAS domain S-box-containing protein